MKRLYAAWRVLQFCLPCYRRPSVPIESRSPPIGSSSPAVTRRSTTICLGVLRGQRWRWFPASRACVWLGDALPFESDPTVSGSTEAFDLTDDGTTIDIHASFPRSTSTGTPKATRISTITVARTGEVRLIVPEPGKTNYKNETSGVEKLSRAAGRSLGTDPRSPSPSVTVLLETLTFFSTYPLGVRMGQYRCADGLLWETETSTAGLFAIGRQVRLLRGRFPALTATSNSSRSRALGSVDLAGWTQLRAGRPTGDALLRHGIATFTPPGSPVKSTQLAQTLRRRMKEQALVPAGTVEFSTGDSFVDR